MNRHQAIIQLNPTVITIIDEVPYDREMHVVAYDAAAVDALVAAERYKEQRRAEYPSFADQFDLLYHGGYDAWKAVIQDIKTKYPKS